ncbi:hypothetical protein HHI36_017793, partial [Cryptolaemus montrouzieri]
MDIPHTESCRRHLRSLWMQPITGCYILAPLTGVQDNINELQRHSSLHGHDTRARDNYVLPLGRIERTQNIFSFLGNK